MSEWKEYKLGELIKDIAAGPFGSNLKVECFVESGFPIIDGANLKGIKVTDNITKYVTEKKARSLHRAIAKRNDIVVTISGNVGQIAYIPDNSKYLEYLVSQRQFRATFDVTRVDVPFLVYYFHTRVGQHKILSFANQVGVPALAQPIKNFREIELELPPIDEQKRIAGILCSLDDKIDLLNRENATLEALAETLFRHYFIENPNPDWKEGKLGDVCSYITEKVETDKLTGMSYISTENMLNGKQGVTESTSIPYNVSVTKYEVGDVLLSNIRPYFKKIWLADSQGGCSNDVLCIRANVRKLECFVYYTLRQDVFFNYVMLGSKGCKMPRGDKQHIMNWPICLPDVETLSIFNQQVSPMIQKIKTNQQQILLLISQRDTLLPHLMSGEVKVGE